MTVADASLIDYEGSGGSYTIVAQVNDGSAELLAELHHRGDQRGAFGSDRY